MAKIKISWKWLLSVLVVLAFSWGGYIYYLDNIKVEPELLFGEAIKKATSANSYRYHVKVTLLGTDTGDNVLSDLNGEKKGPNFHIKGELAREDVEVYQVENATYFRRLEEERWMKTPGNNPFEQTLFLAEINPLASFDFSSYQELQYLGKERVDGQKLYLLTYKPELKEQLLTLYFQDFQYKIWVDKRTQEIRQALIEGTSKVSPQGGLQMQVKLWDYNKPLTISPPKDE